MLLAQKLLGIKGLETKKLSASWRIRNGCVSGRAVSAKRWTENCRL